MIMFSYMPMLQQGSMRIPKNDQEFEKFITEVFDEVGRLAHGKAILWLQDADEDKITPVLVYEEGDAIHEHLKAWAEGDPKGWFDLNVVETVDEEGEWIKFIIFPRVKKSVARHKAANPNFEASQVLFIPLSTRVRKSQNTERFLQQRELVTRVGFLDADHLLLKDPSKVDYDKVVHFEDLKLVSTMNSDVNCSAILLQSGEKFVNDFGFLDVDVDGDVGFPQDN